jgi:beta-lactamase regulating signal transducer with metallopeptidase domain
VTGWLLSMARDLMIFSPFSIALLDRYLLERERLCDRETVAITGDPREYAATLLKVWRLALEQPSYRPHPAAGLTGKKQDMEKRVLSLLHGNRLSSALPGGLFMALLLSVAVVTVLFLGMIC